ncbi:MAG: hypothetical protein PHC61_05955, partial [Chitinivibrionales bacterium]|nr:hypothetical protein [Chitinivibrionales bacterium]
MKFFYFFIVALAGSTFAASTYFVDFSNGLNTNTGISTSAALKNCPGDTAATGVPAATALTGGDTVLFKGGVVYGG